MKTAQNAALLRPTNSDSGTKRPAVRRPSLKSHTSFPRKRESSRQIRIAEPCPVFHIRSPIRELSLAPTGEWRQQNFRRNSLRCCALRALPRHLRESSNPIDHSRASSRSKRAWALSRVTQHASRGKKTRWGLKASPPWKRALDRDSQDQTALRTRAIEDLTASTYDEAI